MSNFHGKERENDSNGRESAGDVRIYMRRKRSEKAVGKEEKSNKRRVWDRLANDTQIKWRCTRSRLCGEAAP